MNANTDLSRRRLLRLLGATPMLPIGAGSVAAMLSACGGGDDSPASTTPPTQTTPAVTLAGGSTQSVTWDVANTNAAPVNATNVRISLSVDGGATWPYVLAESVPNSGAAPVILPSVQSTQARIRIEAVGNVFFDVSDANFTLSAPASVPGDVNADGVVDCADLGVVRASFGRRTGQAGFDARADVTRDGVVDARDLNFVSQRVAAGTSCN